MVIVDTTIWIDYLGGRETPQTLWLDRSLTTTRLGLTDLILCEVLQGVRGERHCEEVRRNLLRCEVFSTGGIELAEAAARNYRALRSKGITVRKTIDCLIATFCLLQGHALLHRDADYDAFERHLGLAVIHP
jgi:predicted nucleic acid-binding protein